MQCGPQSNTRRTSFNVEEWHEGMDKINIDRMNRCQRRLMIHFTSTPHEMALHTHHTLLNEKKNSCLRKRVWGRDWMEGRKAKRESVILPLCLSRKLLSQLVPVGKKGVVVVAGVVLGGRDGSGGDGGHGSGEDSGDVCGSCDGSADGGGDGNGSCGGSGDANDGNGSRNGNDSGGRSGDCLSNGVGSGNGGGDGSAYHGDIGGIANSGCDVNSNGGGKGNDSGVGNDGGDGVASGDSFGCSCVSGDAVSWLIGQSCVNESNNDRLCSRPYRIDFGDNSIAKPGLWRTCLRFKQKASLIMVRGVGGLVNSESALRSPGILLSRVRASPPLLWREGREA
ncbi:hypothetical protein PoB_001055300 [Plakobranchus ocellatus]|uniref:Uncharacterized protein n=1 Tax=Plakobranchus ocellatus TaxID=259542 RepID=A0AAV3YNA6_9GAST|nr:hypothetical protein PoB_001055300 [Plakobranchus ocellatus]